MPAAEIEDVLDASNHYEVLGIDSADASDIALLRRAYLKRSVKVHPDKNNDDTRATQAFQRVTHAYNVLSDDESRARYERYGDEEGNDGSNETQYARSNGDPSFQDAMFVFASVASMMGGARGGVADIANAMYFAEQFLNNEKGLDLSDGKSKAQAAMAGGASLRVVAGSMRAMGFKKTAAATDSAASLVQVAGLGAMVADTPMVKKALEDPAVKRTLDAGSQKLSQLQGSISAAMNRSTQEQSNTQQQHSRGSSQNAGDFQDSFKKAFGAGTERISRMSAAARESMKNRAEGSSSSSTTRANPHASQTSNKSNNYGDSGGMGAMFGAAAASMGSMGNNSGATKNTGARTTAASEPDSFDDTVRKAKAAGAAAGSMKKASETAKRMGFNKQAADLENAASMAEMAGKAAKAADHPMVQSAMQQPAVKRAVEAGAQRMFQEVMKQSTSKT